MCIIIDANVGAEIPGGSEAARPIARSIAKGTLKIVAGHKLKEELLKCPFRRLYRELVLSGRLIEYEYGQIDSELKKLDHATLKSDDGHVIALARVSGARILFSRDTNLHADFKNVELIKDGRVYQTQDHEHLLKEKDACACH